MRKNLSATTGMLIAAIVGSGLAGCLTVNRIWQHKGEVQLTPKAPPVVQGPRVIIFALDGAGYPQLMEAIRSGKAPNMAALMGKEEGGGVFAHAYSAADVLDVLPSSTIADWSAMFTGVPPATNGVTGDEWFVRETQQFYAPVPLSVTELGDFEKMVTGGLVGRALETTTLFKLIELRSNVSLLPVHRDATFYTTVDPSSFADLVGDLIAGKLAGESAHESLSGAIDMDSVLKVIDAINEHGVPNLQVVYFPGIDIFTHASKDRLKGQVEYLENVTDRGIGKVLNLYREKGVLNQTYVLFVADHGHTPVLDDDLHALGTGADSPFGLVQKTGFRVRKAALNLTGLDQDYQAVLAYQGFMAYIYLADRSTCPKEDDRCDWRKPPRLEQDVMPVVRAFDRVNRTGVPIARLKGAIDLIFAREPVASGQPARTFEIFDGTELVPIHSYLAGHPRPDLVDLEQRMNWLGAGPYGNRAGDILLLAPAGMRTPIEKRYYFAAKSRYTWHGSASLQDRNIPLILAQQGDSGARLREIVEGVLGNPPSELAVTPLVRALLGELKSPAQHKAAAPP